MSLLCQLQMTLPGGFPGVLGVTVRLMSDGELTQLEVLRDLDQTADNCRRGAACGVVAALGVPAVEGLS